MKKIIAFMMLVGLIVMPAYATDNSSVPNVFTSGSVISSSQINANFAFLADAMVKGNIEDIILCHSSTPVYYSDGQPNFEYIYSSNGNSSYRIELPNAKMGWKQCFINNSNSSIELLSTTYCTSLSPGTTNAGTPVEQGCMETKSAQDILTVDEIIRSKLIIAHTSPFILYDLAD
jgi:hypothetical protein